MDDRAARSPSFDEYAHRYAERLADQVGPLTPEVEERFRLVLERARLEVELAQRQAAEQRERRRTRRRRALALQREGLPLSREQALLLGEEDA